MPGNMLGFAHAIRKGERPVPLLQDYDSKGNEYLVPGLKLDPYPGEMTVSQLLPGDVLVWYESQAGKTHDLIRETTQGPYTHTGIYIGNGQSVDAGPNGVSCAQVADLINALEVGDVMRYVGLDDERRAKIVEQALRFVGYEYAWRDAIEMTFRRDYHWRKSRAYSGEPDWTVRGAIGKWLIERRKQNGPPDRATYCSQMVIEAYANEVLIEPDVVASGVYSPNDLLGPDIFQYQGYLFKKQVPKYHPLSINADIPQTVSTRAWTGSWLRFLRACLRTRK